MTANTHGNSEKSVSADWQETWAKAQRILCVRLDALGDVLMTTPALRALKHGTPDRHITLLTSPEGAQIARLIADVDDVITYQAPWMKHCPERRSAEPEFAMTRQLARGGYDAAVVFTVYSQNPMPSLILTYLAGIPLRLAHCRENPYQILTHWLKDPEPEQLVRHEVARQLDLVASVGATHPDRRMAIRLDSADHARAAEALLASDVDPARPWLVIHQGATAPSRRYPTEHFAEVATRLHERLGAQIVLTGTPADTAEIEALQALIKCPSHSLAGKLDLAAFAAIIARAPLLISNNTGPAHIAAAVGTPVVDLYALTNPQHTPWLVPSRVLFYDVACKWCYKSVCPEGHQACLRLVPPEAVVRAATELLTRSTSPLEGLNDLPIALDPPLGGHLPTHQPVFPTTEAHDVYSRH